MSDREDNLFRTAFAGIGGFCFDEKVAQVSPDMIRRSVTGYSYVIGSRGPIAKHYSQPNTMIYDLRCSFEATTLTLFDQVTTPGCWIVAVNNSNAMLAQARSGLSDRPVDPLFVEWVHGDIATMAFEPYSIVALSFTFQFIKQYKRGQLFSDIRCALCPGGALILVEKIVKEDLKSQDALNTPHLDFKLANGFSDLEIAGKRQAIENVLIPESVNTNIHRLKRVGFTKVTKFCHCLYFKAWVAMA